jgi:hypothetical protein
VTISPGGGGEPVSVAPLAVAERREDERYSRPPLEYIIAMDSTWGQCVRWLTIGVGCDLATTINQDLSDYPKPSLIGRSELTNPLDLLAEHQVFYRPGQLAHSWPLNVLWD